MTAEHLLPPNATAPEIAMSLATDLIPEVEASITEMRAAKLVSPAPSLLPFLIFEYGLNELSPYVPNLFDLIEEGIRWQRVRGTPDALDKGLGFVGYAGTLEEMPTRWRRWNLFMLELDRLRDVENPDLKNIDGIARLSVPMRSYFWRSFKDYDIRALELGRKKLGQTLLSSFSGVRIEGVKAKWSFGRLHEAAIGLIEAELTQLGVWIVDGDGASLTWGDFSWDEAAASWSDPAAAVRSRLMITGMLDRPVWFEFKNGADEVIGYRKARFSRPVSPLFGGRYTYAGEPYEIDENAPTSLLVEALTGFGEGDGQTATSVGLIFDAIPADVTKPGLQWAEPGELTNLSAPVAVQTGLSVEFGKTIRERFRVRLTVV